MPRYPWRTYRLRPGLILPNPNRPWVVRAITDNGEATLILTSGVVEHASPCVAWALGLPLSALAYRLDLHGWPATMHEG